MAKTFFTIEPTYSGFTDQLTQFSAFYKLGLHLGYDYLHTAFISHRSNGSDIAPPVAGPDIHGFIGLNAHFQRRQQTIAIGANVEPIVMRLSDDIVPAVATGSLAELAGHVERSIGRTSGPALVKFQLDGERKRIFSLIHAAIPQFQDGLDLPALYVDARVRAPIATLHHGDGLKIVVHIRQGDTSVVETPWGSFIPVWCHRGDQLVEYESFASIPSTQWQFEVGQYRQFLDELLARLAPARSSTLVFSDGADRGLKLIESSLEKLAWSPEQIASFNQATAGYDQRQFACFAGMEGIDLHVGETPLKLFQLVHSILEADIVVVSNQQRMAPKLVANLGRENSPKVIVLYKQAIPNNSDVICNDQGRFIYVDIANPDFDSLLRRLGNDPAISYPGVTIND